MEENMSNLTSASGDQTSVSSGLQALEPPKKKRNLPGNPGYIPFTSLDFLDFIYWNLDFLDLLYMWWTNRPGSRSDSFVTTYTNGNQ